MSETDNPYRAPAATLVEPSEHLGGSIEDTLAGNADLDVQAVMSEAWERVQGIKAITLGGWGLVFVLTLLGTLVLNVFLSEWLTQLVVTVALYPVFAGIFMVGLRQSVDLPEEFAELFNHYDKIVPIAAVGVLASIATAIGMFLLILPGLYLAIALSLGIPLVVDKNLSIVDALTTSLKLINQKFLSVLLLVLIAGVVLIAAGMTIIGLIWALPWILMVYAITYRQLAGASVAA